MTAVTHSFSTSGSQLIDVAADVLAERGPMTEEQLVSALGDRGVALRDDPKYALVEGLNDGSLAVLDDGRWVSLPALLAGRVFTHRLTGPEVEHDILVSDPDLAPVGMLVERPEYLRLADGSPVISVVPDYDDDMLAARGVPLDVIGEPGGLLLPPGYLRGRGMGEGDVIAVRVTDDGLLLEAAKDQVPPERLAELESRLSDVLAAASEVPVPLDMAVWTACADDPALFAEPLPPLGEALEACGLAHDGACLAPGGFDFVEWRANARQAAIAQRYNLDDDDALVVLALVLLYQHVAADAAYEVAGASEISILPLLPIPAITQAVLAETTAFDEGDALGSFAESLEPHAPRVARPALRWLRGKASEQLGELAQAEAAYQAAESLDPRWPLALVDLARFASDRGDAAGGLALLRRAGVPEDHHLVELLQRFRTEPRTDIGRNDPCWCGSGRKYKKCHLHNESRTLDERALWLYQKAVGFLSNSSSWRLAMIDAAQARAEYSDSPYALLDALDDPVTADVLLFEGGAFAEFVAIRGALLPEDERLLAEQWLLAERSVYEVEEVRRGEGLTLRDVRTGDVHQVLERAGSQQLKAGSLICARVVPAGDTTQIFGGIEPVALHQRDELVALLDSEPDPVDLISFLSLRFAPPVLQNTEGDPLVLCEVTLRVEDSAALAVELNKTYERAGGTQEWSEYVTTNGMKRVRATLRLDGQDLMVQANSEARVDRVLKILHALDTKLTVVNDSRQPAREAAAAAGTVSPEPAGPEVAAALDQFVRDYEQKWLDEAIPALAGYTPRQAAADPTRRGDLIRLLDSFPGERGKPGVMDVDRLRAALGLG